MSTTLDEQINQLKRAIAEMEAQRAVLGDDAVDASLVPFQEKLAELEVQSEPPKEAASKLPVRQRKLVTLLYMDVVGSTAMTQHLDPEDTLEIMDNALPRLAAPIAKHGGHVTRFTGDGFKAVFGDPIAREDDPEQAIRAGLDILDMSKEVAQEIEKEWGIGDFQVRIGIDTGLAALGGQTEAEDTVMGRVVNLAVRIESAAPPGGLLISHNTYRHVRGVFNVELQEPISAKGFHEPVEVYLVKEIKPRAFRVQTRGVEGVETRIVGRRTEMDTLKDSLYTIFEEGEGQVITISGEAGVGKSRLLYEYQNWLELLPSSQGVRFFQGRGSQETQGLPYSLLRDMFSFRFQILDGDQGEQVRQKVESGFCKVFGGDDDGVMRAHILGQLLGFNFSTSPQLKGVLNDAEQLRNRGLMYLLQYFQTLSQEIPVVTFFEDIHWADDSSLDVVYRIGEYTPQHPVLLVCAARPILFERRPYWGEGQTYHTRIELHPLSKRESRQLVTEILKLADDVPNELRELIVGGAEGNPFYMEELIKMLIEDGVVVPGEETWRIDLTRLQEVDVPSTLAGVLQARLDILPPQERTVLQQASVVGRLFWDRIVSYIQEEGGNGDDPAIIPIALTSLRNRELVYRHEESAFVGAVEYLFKHDVLRDVTYESVIQRLRKSYHGLVADWLVANCGDRISEYYGLIAEHLLRSGRKEQASGYFFKAGESSFSLYSNPEAEQYYRKALELSPPDPLQADILSGLGNALRIQGFSEEAEQILRQAIILYQQAGNSDRTADVYANLARLLIEIDYLDAWNVCQEGLELLGNAQDSPGFAHLLAEACHIAFLRKVTEQIKPLCQQASEMAERVGELEVIADARITLALLEEDISKAITITEEAVNFAESNHLLAQANRAHMNLGYLYHEYLVDLECSLQHSSRSIDLCRQIDNVSALYAESNLIETLAFQGELTEAEEKSAQFITDSEVPETLSNYYFAIRRVQILLHKGEWETALGISRDLLSELRLGGSFQRIANRNLDLVMATIELSHFKSMADLSEAEYALNENIRLGDRVVQSNFLLVDVYTRQNRLSDAFDQLSCAQDMHPPAAKDTNLFRVLRANAEIELARSEGRWDEAIEASRNSLEIYKNCGHRWGWARKLIDLGDALISRNISGDRERASQTYQQSLDMFTEMGAPGYIKVLEERLGEL